MSQGSTKNPVHIRVSSPNDLRKELLLSAEGCINFLQSGKSAYDKLNIKNLERTQLIKEFDELNKLLGNIERAIPKLPGMPKKEIKKPKKQPKAKTPKKEIKKPELPKAVTYSQKLEEELRDIKKKLAAL